MKDKKRIIVIEDDIDLLDNYLENLEDLNLIVDTADNKIEALEKIKCRTYHVAMVDIMLTNDPFDRGGIEVIKYIQSLNEGTNVVVLSASDDVRVPVDAWDQGALKYLVKKYIKSSEDYLKIVRELLEISKLKLYGNFSSLHPYLACPENISYWEDHLSRMLGVSYNVFSEIITKTFDPILPVLRKKDQKFKIQHKDKTVYSQLWSKSLGSGVFISISRDDNSICKPATNLQATHYMCLETYGYKSNIWTISSDKRSDYLDSLYDEKKEKSNTNESKSFWH